MSQFLERGVEKNTRDRYKQHASLWDTYMRDVGSGRDHLLMDVSERERKVLVVNFIKFMVQKKNIGRDEIGRIMSALRFRFVKECAPVAVFSDPSVLLAKKASKRQEKRRCLHLRREQKRRMPVTMDMVEKERERHWVHSLDLDNNMIYIGIVLACNFMWRISQYVMDLRSEEHVLLAQDVLFLREGKRGIWAWDSKMETNRDNVVSVLFVVRSSKTSHGRYLYLSRNSIIESRTVDDVVEWAVASGIGHDDPFLSRWLMGANKKKRQLKLTRRMVNTSLKTLAEQCGLESVGFAFSSKSLRIGGATSMVAAGKSRDTVKRIGWATNSNCDEIYEQNTPLDEGALSIVSVGQFKVLGVEDVRKMLPPGFWQV